MWNTENINYPGMGETGFTLIEALAAIVIFSIGIIGCLKMQMSSTHSNALANRVHTSATWAVYVAERLSTLDFDDPNLADDGTDVGGNPAANGFAGLDDLGNQSDGVFYVREDGSIQNAPGANDIYTIFWNVAEDQPSVLRDVKRIRVHVRKNGGIGSNKGQPLYTHDFFLANSAF